MRDGAQKDCGPASPVGTMNLAQDLPRRKGTGVDPRRASRRAPHGRSVASRPRREYPMESANEHGQHRAGCR